MNKLQKKNKQVYIIAEADIIDIEYLSNHVFEVATEIT